MSSDEPNFNLWLNIYSQTFCRSGGSGGPLRRVPPVYLQGTAGLAVGFAINLANQTKSHLIITSQIQSLQATTKLVKHISFHKCIMTKLAINVM